MRQEGWIRQGAAPINRSTCGSGRPSRVGSQNLRPVADGSRKSGSVMPDVFYNGQE